MLTKDFNFTLPEELIAQTPSAERGEDRLLLLDRKSGVVTDFYFSDLTNLIPENAVIVFNNSKVRRARVYAKTITNESDIEFLMIEPLGDGSQWKVMAKRAKRQKIGKEYRFSDGTEAIIIDCPLIEKKSEFKVLQFTKIIDDAWLDRYGHMPLPPYIHREDTDIDSARYQTIYAERTGSIAAPTAGLHFTNEVFSALDARGIKRVSLTLHVGLGTFLPIRSETLEDHVMHTENFFIHESTAEIITTAKKEGRPILAVGTTSVRTLESAWNKQTNTLQTGWQATNIFIYPGYTFNVIDHLFTNFHTPESSLVMLVSAFAGKEKIMSTYQHAIEKKYKFFSYGDAMLIL